MATALFATVTVAAAGVLTSGIAARSLASQRTAAEHIANTPLEWIRSLDYDNVGCKALACPVTGLVDATGNQAAQSGPTVPANYSVAIMIRWVDDSVPTAFKTYRNYKTVTITVNRASDNKQLSQQSTQVGPRQRAAFGGINLGAVLVQVIDFLSPKNPHPGVTVNLNNGPSSPLADMTDGAGKITFPGLTPTSGSQHYDLDVPTFDGGWIYLPDPTTTHFQLAAGSEWRAALLSQNDTFGAWGNGFTSGASCTNSGASGNIMSYRGSFTTDHGGSFSGWFDTRDYLYDTSLIYLPRRGSRRSIRTTRSRRSTSFPRAEIVAGSVTFASSKAPAVIPRSIVPLHLPIHVP